MADVDALASRIDGARKAEFAGDAHAFFSEPEPDMVGRADSGVRHGALPAIGGDRAVEAVPSTGIALTERCGREVREVIRAGTVMLAAVALAATALTLPSSATTRERRDPVYLDTGYDPDDVPIDEGSCCQQDPDVRSTTRKVATNTNGGRSLFITFRTYEPLEGYWTVRVFLDTRGGSHTDAKMRLADSGGGPTRCGVRFLAEGPRRQGTLHLPRSGDRATCRVPLQWVHPTKRIRWRLYSVPGLEGTEPGVDEYAPDDRGWYL